MDVRTNRGIFLNSVISPTFDVLGVKPEVTCNPVSNEMYVVAAKNNREMNPMGRMDLMDPSSTN
jgi:hypothetical protein